MTEPNPTIDLAKARADWDAYESGGYGEVWAPQYAEPLLTALEQMQAENEHLRNMLGRMCDAYKLVCDDNGTRYYQSQGSVYAHEHYSLDIPRPKG